MIRFLVPLFLYTASLFAEMDYHKILHDFTESLGRNGSWKQEEIEIATSPEEIQRIEKSECQRLIRLGYSKDEAQAFTKTGVIAEDHHWIWVRDAVTFPGGIPGTYNRIMVKSGLNGPHGTVIFPVLPNNKVVVNINFRHATRSWEMELPRGHRKGNETAEQAAFRELKEETGCIADKFVFLGNLAPATGVVSGVIPVFYSQVREKKGRNQDSSEAIVLNIEVTIDEVKEAFIKGYLITDIKGVMTKIYCRDPFLSFAFMQATWRKLI